MAKILPMAFGTTLIEVRRYVWDRSRLHNVVVKPELCPLLAYDGVHALHRDPRLLRIPIEGRHASMLHVVTIVRDIGRKKNRACFC